MIGRIGGRFDRVRNLVVHRKSVRPKLNTGLISFTFDDFPRSAYTVGGKILKSYDMQATYYVAFGLMGGTYVGGDLFLKEDLEGALHDGHELASHTYSHINCCELSASDMHEELDRNDNALMNYMADSEQPPNFVNFSYPFGGVAPTAKKLVKDRFASGRGIRGGVNNGVFDLTYLRANSLYSESVPLENMERLIGHNERTPGWLIFYTHDVCDTPSRFGCTSEYFERLVSIAAASNCRVLNVRNAIGVLASSL